MLQENYIINTGQSGKPLMAGEIAKRILDHPNFFSDIPSKYSNVIFELILL